MNKLLTMATLLASFTLASCGGSPESSSHGTGFTSESSHATGLTSESKTSEESHATGLTSESKESSHATGLTTDTAAEQSSHDTGFVPPEESSHDTGFLPPEESSEEEVLAPYTLIGKFDDANWDRDVSLVFDEDYEAWILTKHFLAGDQFKIRKDQGWDVSYGFDLIPQYDLDWGYDCFGEGSENNNIAVLAICTLNLLFDPTVGDEFLSITAVPDDTPTDWCKGFKEYWQEKFHYVPPFIYFDPVTVNIMDDDWAKYDAGSMIQDAGLENIFEKYNYADALVRDGWNEVAEFPGTFEAYEVTKDEGRFFCTFGIESDGLNTLYFYANFD